MDLHFQPDRCDAADQCATLVGGDTVAAAKRRFWTEHAQNPFCFAETMTRIFQNAYRQFHKTPAKIDQLVPTEDQLARGTTCLQRGRNVEQAALVTVDLVVETTA